MFFRKPRVITGRPHFTLRSRHDASKSSNCSRNFNTFPTKYFANVFILSKIVIIMEILSKVEESVFQQVKEVIAQRISRLIEDLKGKSSSKKIIRLEILCPDIDCFVWLNGQRSENKIYWADRNGDFEMAGIGAADLLKGDDLINYKELFFRLRQRLSVENKYLRYYGGVGFYNKKPGKEWQAFGSYFFIVPQFEIFKVKGKSFFAFNIKADNINLSGINESISKLNSLIFPCGRLAGIIPKVCSLQHSPDRAHWEKIFNENIRLSGEMMFDKIVLARKTFIDFEENINPLFLFSRLKENTKGCFHYYFQPSMGAVFLGATPERLFKRNGLKVESEALAGTKPCGKSKHEDTLYQQELFYSAKEILEHRYVFDSIRDTLSEFCSALEFDKTCSILKATTVQHLISRFQGQIKKGTSDAQLLSALHPTPAVGGCPLDKALKAISEIEPFSRGWYAGPVGFVGYDYVDFSVALRCALVRGKNISLFSGVGIVEGSTPEEEWQEIENKNSVYMRIFDGLEARQTALH